MTRREALYYLSAIIDGEGYVCGWEGKGYTRSVSIYNSEKPIIKRVVQCLEILELPCAVYLETPTNKNHSPVYNVVLSGSTTLKFLVENLDLASEIKTEKLKLAYQSYRSRVRRSKGTARPTGW